MGQATLLSTDIIAQNGRIYGNELLEYRFMLLPVHNHTYIV